MPFDSTNYSDAPSHAEVAEPVTKTNLRRVRDFIAGLPANKFLMCTFGAFAGDDWRAASSQEVKHGCGTAACIAGWANALLSTDDIPNLGERPFESACALLGLQRDDGEMLFWPWNLSDDFDWVSEEATPAQAVRVLDHLIETGEVDWSKALEGE